MNLLKLLAILILVSITYPSTADNSSFQDFPSPSTSVPTQNSSPTSPFITMFQVSTSTSDFAPYVITPVTDKTEFVIAFNQRNNKPPLSQIVNYTIGAGPKLVLPQAMNGTVPSDIVYDSG